MNNPIVLGELVQTWFDSGPRSGGYIFGRVVKSGPRTFTVLWESGIRNRCEQGTASVKAVTDPDLREEAERVLRVEHQVGFSAAGTLCGEAGSTNVVGRSQPCPKCSARIQRARASLLAGHKRSA